MYVLLACADYSTPSPLFSLPEITATTLSVNNNRLAFTFNNVLDPCFHPMTDSCDLSQIFLFKIYLVEIGAPLYRYKYLFIDRHTSLILKGGIKGRGE